MSSSVCLMVWIRDIGKQMSIRVRDYFLVVWLRLQLALEQRTIRRLRSEAEVLRLKVGEFRDRTIVLDREISSMRGL